MKLIMEFGRMIVRKVHEIPVGLKVNFWNHGQVGVVGGPKDCQRPLEVISPAGWSALIMLQPSIPPWSLAQETVP